LSKSVLDRIDPATATGKLDVRQNQFVRYLAIEIDGLILGARDRLTERGHTAANPADGRR
jgi:hypothetical protein